MSCLGLEFETHNKMPVCEAYPKFNMEDMNAKIDNLTMDMRAMQLAFGDQLERIRWEHKRDLEEVQSRMQAQLESALQSKGLDIKPAPRDVRAPSCSSLFSNDGEFIDSQCSTPNAFRTSTPSPTDSRAPFSPYTPSFYASDVTTSFNFASSNSFNA